MDYLNKLCTICLCGKEDLQPLFDMNSGEITYYIKLTTTIPEMCFKEMNNQRLICKECCDNINTIYDFRKKCLKSKKVLIKYISRQYYNNNVKKVNIQCHNSKSDNDGDETICEDDYEEKSENEVKVPDDKISLTEIGTPESSLNEQEISKKPQEKSSLNTCEVCLKSCSNLIQFKIKKQDVNVSVCKDCFHRLMYKNNLSDLPNHVKIKTYKCENCGKIFDKKNVVKLNGLPHLEQADVFKCIACYKSSNEASVVPEDIKMESQTEVSSYICDKCGIIIDKRDEFWQHIQDHYVDEFICYMCSRIFNSEFALHEHVRGHSNSKDFICHTCGKMFNKRSLLRVHSRSHTGFRPYKCQYCTKKFSRGYNLDIHIRSHTNDKRYICEICKKSFIQSSHLKTHQKIHKNEKPWTCFLCNKSFTQKHNCLIHVRTHMGKRPFLCKICDEHHISKEKFIEHMQTHNDGPNFCNICKKKFHHDYDFKMHMQIHGVQETEQLFVCCYCMDCFDSDTAFNKHMFLMHIDQNDFE